MRDPDFHHLSVEVRKDYYGLLQGSYPEHNEVSKSYYFSEVPETGHGTNAIHMGEEWERIPWPDSKSNEC